MISKSQDVEKWIYYLCINFHLMWSESHVNMLASSILCDLDVVLEHLDMLSFEFHGNLKLLVFPIAKGVTRHMANCLWLDVKKHWLPFSV